MALTVHPGVHHGLCVGLATGDVLAAQPLHPGCRGTVPGVAPSGSVWPKKSRAAMSSLKSWASAVSGALVVTGLQPTFARSWLTRASTAAWAEVADGLDEGVALPVGAAEEGFGAAGAVVAGADEDFFGVAAGAFVRSGAFDADFDAEADGSALGFALGVAEGEFEGEAERPDPLSASADAEAEVRPVGSSEDSPWVRRSGAPPAWTWSAAPPPLML